MSQYEMNSSLLSDALRAIDFDFGTEASRKSNGQYINSIKCPTCGKAEAFTSSAAPWVVKCGRLNNCGESHHIKELFPHLFESWTDRYQPKTEVERQRNPTAVADGYMRDGRGFNLMLVKGWYTQEYYQNHDINQGSTTVRFQLPGNAFWERVLDKPERFGKLKARAVNPYKGEVWQAPIHTLEQLVSCESIIITEGIFDAISWIQSGHVAVSCISSSNYPDNFLAQIKEECLKQNKPRPAICFALDGDKAGRMAIGKMSTLAEKDDWVVQAAQSENSSYDWNDLLQLGRMTPKHIEEYFYRGELILAKRPGDKAVLIYSRKEKSDFWFEFDSQLYWFNLSSKSYEQAVQDEDILESEMTPEKRNSLLMRCGSLKRISTAIPTPLYFQSNNVTQEHWYFFAVETAEAVGKLAFTPSQITSNSEFKNRLLAHKNAWWTGSGEQLERYLMDKTHNIKTVETIDYIGYSKEHETYVWNEVAVRHGRIAKINKEDFYQFGRMSLKTLASSPEIHVSTNKQTYRDEWSRHVVGAFGEAGIVSVAFFLGSLFAEQIRGTYKSFPFFELVGDAGAGKSTLIEFLWKLLGRDEHEGFDPQKSTAAARARLFNQVSNMPVVLIESDREANDTAKAKQFDWDDLKTAFNGRSMRSRGVKNSGNDTYDPPFRGTIMISQNDQVMASEAILSRIIHITVTRTEQTQETKKHAEWLERAPVENLSYFLLHATSQEKAILDVIDERTSVYEERILATGQVPMLRIAKNHAQMAALIDCLGPKCLNVFTEKECIAGINKIVTMAMERQLTINADHPIVQEFWEAVDYIDSIGDIKKLNHLGYTDDAWAINLKEFENIAGEYRLRIPEMRVLKSLLRTSKDRKFVEASKTIRSRINTDRTTKCWVFESKRGASGK